jgi:hypothetical protein
MKIFPSKRWIQIVTSVMLAIPSTLALISYFYPLSHTTILTLLLTGMVITALYYTFFRISPDFRTFSKKSSWAIIGFLPLFSLFLMFSLKKWQTFLPDSFFILALVYIGTFVVLNVLCFCIIIGMLRVQFKTPRETVSKKRILLYSLPFWIISLFYLFAFYPGFLSPDSLWQWAQAHNGQFNDWHPIVHTWLMMGLLQIWDSPAIVSLFQIACMGAVFGYCLYRFEIMGIPRWILTIVAWVFAISPLNPMYAITLWKDILYSTSVLLYSMLLVNIVVTHGEWIKKNSSILLYTIASCGFVFLRHNGFPVFVVTVLVFLIIYRLQLKKMLISSAVVIVLHFIVTGPVFQFFHVVPTSPSEKFTIPIQQVALVLQKNGQVTDEQAAFLNRVLPLVLWKQKYRSFSVNPIKFDPQFDVKFINKHQGEFLKIWLDIVRNNPKIAAEAYLKQTSLVWEIKTAYMMAYITKIQPDNKQVKHKVFVESYTHMMRWIMNGIHRDLVVPYLRPAFYTFALLLFSFVAILRNSWRFSLILLPVLCNTAVVAVSLPAPDFRYLFINTLFAFIAFLLGFVYQSPKSEAEV